MRTIAYVCQALMLAGTIAPTNTALAQAGSSLAVSYSLPKTDLTVREPVFLRVTVENYLDEPVTVDLGTASRGNFRARILRPDGRTETAPTPTLDEFGPTGRTPLAPHKPFSELLLLNRWFDFDLPGRYFLDMETTAPFVTGSGTRLAAPPGGSVIINVGPPDPERLGRTCAVLEGRVNASATSAAAIEAAETLSYVRDPVAVPYLARLLDNGKNVEWLAVYGLERVADISAVDALISQLNSRATETNSRATETRMLALAALRRIEETTSDPTIRQRIEGARR